MLFDAASHRMPVPRGESARWTDLRSQTNVNHRQVKTGALHKEKQIPKMRDYFGSGWEGPGLARNNFFWENRPKIALNHYLYFGVVYQWRIQGGFLVARKPPPPTVNFF